MSVRDGLFEIGTEHVFQGALAQKISQRVPARHVFRVADIILERGGKFFEPLAEIAAVANRRDQAARLFNRIARKAQRLEVEMARPHVFQGHRRLFGKAAFARRPGGNGNKTKSDGEEAGAETMKGHENE